MGTIPGIFRAYDIRGIWPEEIDGETGYRIAQAYVSLMKPTGEVMVGRDVRIHSEELKNKVIEGLTDAGIDVVDIGLVSTDMLYFGVGNYQAGGGFQVTASHNPAEWHGMKMVKVGVAPISGDSGIYEIRDWVMAGNKVNSQKKGRVRNLDILDDYCRHILGWIDARKVKPMKVVINPNFGFAGKAFHRIVELGNLPLEVVDLNTELDGNFPKGRPDPLIPDNRVELLETVKSKEADLGITWDADADRCFFCADGGEFTDPYYVLTFLIKLILEKHPGGKVVYDCRYTWALIDAIKENGGVPIISKVGHSYIKERMRTEGAVFGAESSGHTYYKDYWFADCGMIPAMQIIEYLSVSRGKLSVLLQKVMEKYPISGEINFRVTNAKEITEKIAVTYKDAKLETIDGLSVEYPDYRFNLRMSNNEPLLRLNLEARDLGKMKEKLDEVEGHIKEWGVFVKV